MVCVMSLLIADKVFPLKSILSKNIYEIAVFYVCALQLCWRSASRNGGCLQHRPNCKTNTHKYLDVFPK